MAEENIFEKLKTDFEFDIFLENVEGYQFFPRDSKKTTSTSNSNLDGYEYKAFKEMQGTSTISTLLVSRNANGHYVYNNPNDSSDRGTVIDYLMKHKRMDWKDIAAFAKDSNIELPETEKKQRAPKKEDKSTPAEVIDVDGYRSNPYFDNDRAIEDVINSNNFIKYAINHVKFKRHDQEGKAQVLYGHAFPIRNHQGEVTTYNMKSDFFKRGMFLGERKSGLWYAMPKETPTSFIVGEAAIDVISYYKNLESNEPIGLISTEGRFSSRYANELQLLLPDINQSEVTLVNDNDVHGFHYDLAWIQHLHNLPYSVGVKKTGPDKAFIRIESTDEKLSEELKELQGGDYLLKPESIIPAIKHIKEKFGIDKLWIHKSPDNDWNQKIVADSKKNHE